MVGWVGLFGMAGTSRLGVTYLVQMFKSTRSMITTDDE